MKPGLALLLGFILSLWGTPFAQELNDIEQYRYCKYCNMDRGQYARSRMLVTYSDGSQFGACSIHCVAIDLALHIDKTPQLIQVADYNSRELLEAESAYWVIGGNLPGVMTKRAKWAFKSSREAEDFVERYGGKLGTFDQAMEASFEDMYADSKMIRNKRKLRNMHIQE